MSTIGIFHSTIVQCFVISFPLFTVSKTYSERCPNIFIGNVFRCSVFLAQKDWFARLVAHRSSFCTPRGRIAGIFCTCCSAPLLSVENKQPQLSHQPGRLCCLSTRLSPPSSGPKTANSAQTSRPSSVYTRRIRSFFALIQSPFFVVPLNAVSASHYAAKTRAASSSAPRKPTQSGSTPPLTQCCTLQLDALFPRAPAGPAHRSYMFFIG